MKAIFRRQLLSYRLSVSPTTRVNVKGVGKMGYTSSSKDGLQPKKDSISQGHINDPSNLHKQDVQSQSAESGKNTKKTAASGGAKMDAASDRRKKDMRPEDTGTGNPEGVGMVDQVGSASGSARQFEKK